MTKLWTSLKATGVVKYYRVFFEIKNSFFFQVTDSKLLVVPFDFFSCTIARYMDDKISNQFKLW